MDSELSEKPHVLTTTGPWFLRVVCHLRKQRKPDLCLVPECLGTGTKFWKAEGFLYGGTSQTQGRSSIGFLFFPSSGYGSQGPAPPSLHMNTWLYQGPSNLLSKEVGVLELISFSLPRKSCVLVPASCPIQFYL